MIKSLLLRVCALHVKLPCSSSVSGVNVRLLMKDVVVVLMVGDTINLSMVLLFNCLLPMYHFTSTDTSLSTEPSSDTLQISDRLVPA